MAPVAASVQRSIASSIQGSQKWDPLVLFKSGAAGAWYDPSDLSTLFQDSSGAIPVTTAGDPVGLMLDKSKGLVLGAEVVTNGTFDSATTGWASIGSATLSWDASGAALVNITGSGAGLAKSQTWALTVGRTYEITFDAKGGTYVGSLDVTVSSGLITAGLPITTEYSKKSVKFVATVADSAFQIQRATAAVGTVFIDNISVRELPGNHAVQATAASRPIYRQVGTLRYLEFDGVDDSLESSQNHQFNLNGPMSIFGGFNRTGAPKLYEALLSVASPGTAQSCALLVGGGSLNTDVWGPAGIRGTTPIVAGTPYVVGFNTPNWATHKSSGLSTLRSNGSNEPWAIYGGGANSTALVVSRMRVGVYNPTLGASFYAGAIFGTLALTRELTAPEISAVERYIGKKSGATI
jgi:hypothetical protein